MTVCPKASCPGELLSRPAPGEFLTLLVCAECGETYKAPEIEAEPPVNGPVEAYRMGRHDLADELLNFYTRPSGPEGMLALLESVSSGREVWVDEDWVPAK